jgi:hypothetical protein
MGLSKSPMIVGSAGRCCGRKVSAADSTKTGDKTGDNDKSNVAIAVAQNPPPPPPPPPAQIAASAGS